LFVLFVLSVLSVRARGCFGYIKSFPLEYQEEISDLFGFIRMVQKKQESLPKYFII